MNNNLVYQAHSEEEADLIKEKLINKGINAVTNYQNDDATKTLNSNPLGVFVPEDKLDEAKAVIASAIAFPNNHNPSVNLGWKTAVIIIFVAIILVILYVNRIIF